MPRRSTGFLARYREPTLTAYAVDVKTFLGWCHGHDVEMLRMTTAQLESYVRHLEVLGCAPATIARRIGTVATFHKYAVIDGVIPTNPALPSPAPAWPGRARRGACWPRWSSLIC
jgi:integrase/recombinase XerD